MRWRSFTQKHMVISAISLILSISCTSTDSGDGGAGEGTTAEGEALLPTPPESSGELPDTPSEPPAAADTPVTPEDTAVTGSLTDPDPATPVEAAPAPAPGESVIDDVTADQPIIEESVPPPLDADQGMPAAGKAKGKKAKGKKGQGPVTRIVKAARLNVRAKPNLKAKTVAVLKHGDEVQAEIKGGWAKIGPGQWVRAKHLSKPGGTAKKKKKKKQ